MHTKKEQYQHFSGLGTFSQTEGNQHELESMSTVELLKDKHVQFQGQQPKQSVYIETDGDNEEVDLKCDPNLYGGKDIISQITKIAKKRNKQRFNIERKLENNESQITLQIPDLMKREPKEQKRPRPKHSSQNVPKKESIRGSVGSQQSEILEDNPNVVSLFKEKYNELVDNYEFVFPSPKVPQRQGQPSKERVLAPVEIPQMRAKMGSNKKSSINSPSPTRLTRDSLRLSYFRQDSSPLQRPIKKEEQEIAQEDVRTFYEQIQMKQGTFLLNMSVVDQSLKSLLEKEQAKIQKWRDEAKAMSNSRVKFLNGKRTSRRYSSFKKRGRAT